MLLLVLFIDDQALNMRNALEQKAKVKKKKKTKTKATTTTTTTCILGRKK